VEGSGDPTYKIRVSHELWFNPKFVGKPGYRAGGFRGTALRISTDFGLERFASECSDRTEHPQENKPF
jgi:hypothetical protein